MVPSTSWELGFVSEKAGIVPKSLMTAVRPESYYSFHYFNVVILPLSAANSSSTLEGYPLG